MIVIAKRMKNRNSKVSAQIAAIAEAQRQAFAERLAACQARKDELREQAEVLTPTIFEPVVRRSRRKGRNRRRMQ